ncbi:hypothetical protein [Tepidibacter aestuarii]|uniref:hypothetical protein n=1 Tax=Tepidibacter aestuarii TaxID=2925782 RepID=UPI0020C0209D|nr:hypothetical protein [Tepidibacter aestuarii]CAH2211922.1 conserved protein of unknown function [Tepidibacter aestuarii]
MKGKKIVTGILLAGILAGGGYNCYNLAQNNASLNVLKTGVVYAEKSQEIKNKDLNNVAMEAIKKYYGESPNFNKLKFKHTEESLEEQISGINDTIEFIKNSKSKFKEDEQFIRDLEEEKNKIKFGTISMAWISDDELYSVTFDDQSKEILSVIYETQVDLNKIKPENFVSIEQAKKTAEDFIVKNNLDNIKDMKLTGKSEYKNHNDADYDVEDTVMFFYQDANDSSKKANLVIDRNSGKVTYFSVGYGAEREYIKNDI